MTSPVIYAYVLTSRSHEEEVVFTWPNVVRKFIRDMYTFNGELHLPPTGHLTLTRHKVNPKAGTRPVADVLDIEVFLAAGN